MKRSWTKSMEQVKHLTELAGQPIAEIDRITRTTVKDNTLHQRM